MIKYFDTALRKTGGPYPGVIIVVRLFPSEALAPIYTNDGSGLITNSQVVTDADGYFEFFCDPGRYILDYSFAGATLRRIVNVDVGGIQVLEDLSEPTGSNLVGFIQAGTGAVARTALAKMRERISAADYGAVGDFVSDDTSAIMQAIAAAAEGGAREVYLGPGTFKVSVSNLNRSIEILYDNVSLVGAGEGATTIKLDSGQDAYVLYAEGRSGLRFRDITFDGSSADQTDGVSGVFLLDCSDFVFERVTATNAYGHGFYSSVGGGDSTDSVKSSYLFCSAISNGVAGNLTTGTGFAGNGDDVALIGCRAEQNNLGGFKQTGRVVRYVACYASNNERGGFANDFSTAGQGCLKFDGCVAEDNGLQGFYLSQTTDSVDLIGCTSQRNGVYGLYCLNNVTNLRVVGGEFRNNGQASPGYGIFITDTSGIVGRVSLIGVACFDDQAVKTQDYGVLIEADAENVYIDGSCDLAGNATGAIKIDTTKSDIIVSSGVRGLTCEKAQFTNQQLTGVTVETDIVSMTVNGYEMGNGGALRFSASGGASGTNGTKQVRMYVGGTSFLFYNRAAGDTDDWYVEGIISTFGTALNVRWILKAFRNGGTAIVNTTSVSVDTKSSWVIKLTGQLGSSLDTLSVDSFFVERVR